MEHSKNDQIKAEKCRHSGAVSSFSNAEMGVLAQRAVT